MGFTLDARGKPAYNDTSDPLPDLQAAADWADLVGAGFRGTATQRGLLTAGEIDVGQLFVETDTGKVLQWTGSTWLMVFAPATESGTSVVPTAAAGYSLSGNKLYTRNGFLLGQITFARASGVLTHGEAVMTLPAGARPVDEYNADAILTLAASASLIWQLRVQTTGVVQVVSPPDASRTGGTVSFRLPIPL